MKLRARFKQLINYDNENYRKFNFCSFIGCSLEELKIYLQRLFSNDMSWHGILSGEIHIDHIKPLCLFDLTKEKEVKEAFHYTNLQPLWALDNLKKNKIYVEE